MGQQDSISSIAVLNNDEDVCQNGLINFSTFVLITTLLPYLEWNLSLPKIIRLSFKILNDSLIILGRLRFHSK